jgi:signal transduction histidine kinase/uncharacterized cupin superfamily protein
MNIQEKSDFNAHVSIVDDGQATLASNPYEYEETRELVYFVNRAADLIRLKGEAAWNEFQHLGSRWRNGDTYIFALDPEGNMLVHPDPLLEGKNQLGLKDINGKPIVRGLLTAATSIPERQEGWYHYQWIEPRGLLPRWKSSYVQGVRAPSGKQYIVGSGLYNDRLERAFVVDAVMHAVGELALHGQDAFQIFHDPSGPYIFKNTYIFVVDMNGVELVNPAFPNIEGRKLLDLQDTNGKFLYRDIIQLVKTRGAGWVDYMWPKPGESASTRKSTYVHTAKIDGRTVAVGCGVYLADAPSEFTSKATITASALTELVHQAATLLEEQGESAYPKFRDKGSKWFNDETYIFVFTMDGVRAFHAAEPDSEGRQDIGLTDIVGRHIVKMMLEAGSAPFGEGWVHYMYPEPGDIFPAWKSSIVMRVTYPSGKQYIVGCGIYNMQMDKAFIEDVVNSAAALIASQGRAAFPIIRDKTGPFVFMDTYVFVQSLEGVELVNAAQPSFEGKNLIDLKDLKGKSVVRDEIAIALTEGSAWIESYWYKPGDNIPALKQTYIRKVQFQEETFIVGSGLYVAEGHQHRVEKFGVQKMNWHSLKVEKLHDNLERQTIYGEKGTLARFVAKGGTGVVRHYHESEEYCWVVSGMLQFNYDDKAVVAQEGDVVVIPANIPHAVAVLQDTVFIDFFAPSRTDWLRGEDQYLRMR